MVQHVLSCLLFPGGVRSDTCPAEERREGADTCPIRLVAPVPKIAAAKSHWDLPQISKMTLAVRLWRGPGGEIVKIVTEHWFQKWNRVTMPV